MPPSRPVVRRAVGLAAVLALTAGVAAGAAWFQPWRLWTTTTVIDEVPLAEPLPATPSATAPTTPQPTAEPTAPASTATTASVPAATAAPAAVELARGALVSHEHPTSGTARVLRLADGSRSLVLEGLSTSDGPDVHVWLAAAPVLEGRAGWYVFDDGGHRDLGRLKGNRGRQVYAIPADVDLDALTSVSLWCERFSVSFGAAALT